MVTVVTTKTFVDWLRRRTDDQLLTLLRRRPDLSAPAAPDLVTLANRIGVRSSIVRALDSLDSFALHILEAIAVLDHPTPATVAAGIGPGPVASDAIRSDVDDAFERLFDHALIWSVDDVPRLAGGVLDVLGPYPSGLGAPAAVLLAQLTGDQLAPIRATLDIPVTGPGAAAAIAAVLANPRRRAELVDARSPTARQILTDLAHGTPVGALPADFDADSTGPVWELLNHGLLIRDGPVLAELPREIGLHMRAPHPLDWVDPHPPAAFTAERPPADVDATGSVAVLETLRLIDALAALWSAEPPGQLRSGGLGVRDLRRTARALGVDEPVAAVLIEVAVAADLIAAPMSREIDWLPTTDYDTWTVRDPAVRWVRLAQAWRTMTRQPQLIGQRDERGKARAALSYEIERSTAPAVRAEVMAVLAGAPAGAVGPPAAVLAHLAWLTPRRARVQADASAAALAEAELLGITGAGGLTSYGRGILAGAPADAANGLSGVLPTPVDYFLVQPDLTIVVPGPPQAALARELVLVADLESAGGASVYRVSEASLRRAFDAGRTAQDVHALFATRSRTPVPQALAYLIDDLARRYGLLRAGPTQSYLRCADVALLDRVVGDRAVATLAWHRLAPTVAVSASSTARVLEVLRAAGYAPAGEDGRGVIVAAGESPARARPRRPESARQVPTAGAQDAALAEAVRRMRTGDDLSRTAHRVSVSPQIPGITSATTLGVLRHAIRTDRQVWLAVADSAGSASTFILSPLSLGGGFLRGHDVETGEFRSVALHRITSVNVLDGAEPP